MQQQESLTNPMELISIDENELPTFSAMARTLKPFKEVIVKSRTKGIDGNVAKKVATDRLAYVYFMVHYLSPYVDNYIDITLRHQKVCQALGFDSDWDPTPEVREAMQFMYDEFQKSSALSMLEGAKEAAFEVENYLRQAKRGTPGYDVKEVMSTLKSVADAIDGLEKLEERVRKNLASRSHSKIKGGGSIGDFEDPKSLGL